MNETARRSGGAHCGCLNVSRHSGSTHREVGFTRPHWLTERHETVVNALHFRVPSAPLKVYVALRASRPVGDRHYILTPEFHGLETAIDRERLPEGLLWSSSLNCPFVYLPAIDNPGTLRLPPFTVPAGTTSMTVHIRPWASREPNQPDPYDDLVLETTLLERDALIIGKEI